MTSRIRKSLALLRFELAIQYRFPVVELIIGLVLGLSLAVIGVFGQNPYISIIHDPAWNGSQQVEYYLELARKMAISTFALTNELLAYVVAFTVPMLVGFNLGKSMENGFANTSLSYPVSRRALIAAKSVIPISLVVTCGASIPFLSNLLFIPSEKPADAFLLVEFCFSAFTVLVVSTALLLSIIGKRASAAAAGGTGAWLLLLLLVSTTNRYPLIRGIINPVQMAGDYLTLGTQGPLLGDVLASSALCLVLGIVILVVCMLLFERVDL